jgi:hypothetical protein
MLKTLAICVFGVAALHAQATWKDCTPAGSPGKISKVDIVPSQPTKGAKFLITGHGTINETVASGKYTLTIDLGGIPVFTHTGDGCKPDHVVLPLGMGTIDFDGLTCPVKAGSVTVQLATTIAKTAPSGKYTASVKAQDASSTEILCAEVDFTLAGQERKQAPLSLVFQKEWLQTHGGVVNGHYGDPKDGCESDEKAVQVQGVAGDFCAPECSSSDSCPADIPTGVTAKPECALQTPSGAKYCALICSPSLPIKNQFVADAQCGQNASCKAISGVGICTYND